MKDKEQRLSRQQRRDLEKKQHEQTRRYVPTVSIAETRLLQHSAIIEREAKKRGIVFNKVERDIWDTPPISIESSDSVSIMEEKIADMLSRTEQSRNPHVTAAVEDFMRLTDTRGLRTLIQQGNSGMAMAAGVDKTEDGKNLELRLILSDAGISLIDHPFNLASVFVHEMEHLRDIEEFDQNLQELPIDERFARHGERSTDSSIFRAMEARATGVQYEAIINHFGMIQEVPEYIPLKQVEFVADYIKTGCDPVSQRWIDAIARHEAQGLVSVPKRT